MAGLPLKSGADFYNLEAARLRLHNLGADPTEVGAGLIYFNTSSGMNTSKKARIYTGDAWKTIAFSEDLDVASNADFLALKDRVDLLSGDIDTDAIISNMKEVSAFLEGFAENANLMDYLNTELGKKLDLTGGTINGKLTISRNVEGDATPLEIQTTDVISTLRFRTKDSLVYFGYNQSKGLFVTNNGGWNNEYRILHSGNFASLIGDTYLKTSGGTINGRLFIGSPDNTAYYHLTLIKSGAGLRINNLSNEAYLAFGPSDSIGDITPTHVLAFGENGLRYSDDGVTSYHTLIHSGNVGNYALKTENYFSLEDSLNVAGYSGTNQGWKANGAAMILGYSSDYRWAIQAYGGGAAGHKVVSKYCLDGTWTDWHEIAFTDSDITGNAATANGFKIIVTNQECDLNTALTGGGLASTYYAGANIHWQNAPEESRYGAGIQFNTNNGLDGQLFWDITNKADDTTRSLWWRAQDDRGFDNAKWHQIAFTDSTVAAAKKLTTDSHVYASFSDTGKYLLFGATAAEQGYNTYVDGYNIYFRYGGGYTSAMTITAEGNINVGDAYFLDALFSVKGLTSIYVSGSRMSLDDLPENGLVLGGVNYTLAQFLQNSGNFAIQSYRKDTKTALALNLNPLGGEVNIASANANTNVLGHLFASKDLYMSGFLMMNHGKEGIYMTGSTISWHNTKDAYTDSLLTFANDSFTIHPTLYANGLANFSSRVLIGAVTDDTESALQVMGKITVGHSAVDRLILTTQDVTAVFDGHDELDGWMDYVFKSDGDELFYIGAQLSQTSRFRRAIRFYGTVTIGGSLVEEGDSTFGGQSTFNGLALFNKPIVAKDTLQIGDATISWDEENNALKVDKNFIVEGEISGGGRAEEGGTIGGGDGAEKVTATIEVGLKFKEISHTLGDNVIVQVYEWNANGQTWDMILTDVETSTNRVTVRFGNATDVPHKVVII